MTTPMEFVLLPHSDAPPKTVRAVRVEILETVDDLLITYTVEGADGLRLPAWQSPARADGLWETTCFELFLQPDGSDGYFEFNFSPSLRWAAYQFDGHRAGMRDMPLDVPPHIDPCEKQNPFELEVDLELDAIIPEGGLRMGLTAVIEEIDGTKSFWALAHPADEPDFHNRDCFTARLPAPRAS